MSNLQDEEVSESNDKLHRRMVIHGDMRGIRLYAPNANAVPARTASAERGRMIRAENQSVPGCVGEILLDCCSLVDVVSVDKDFNKASSVRCDATENLHSSMSRVCDCFMGESVQEIGANVVVGEVIGDREHRWDQRGDDESSRGRETHTDRTRGRIC